jgi:alkylated DNA repair protein (DNA oxidative demethylase)
MSQLALAWSACAAPRALDDGAAILPGAALTDAPTLVAEIDAVFAVAPPVSMETPGGGRMSVRLSNCGDLGWVSDARGYRYSTRDLDGTRWPPMASALRALATRCAAAVGYRDFAPDACLINEYAPGARMGLHQDRQERDDGAPIVSVSLGLPATFLWGGLERTGPLRRLRLEHGDVVVWGGPSRMVFHGVAPIAPGYHPLVGARRLNLTFRTAR